MFAEVELHVGGVSGAPPELARYEVRFVAKQQRWAYYCVTDLLPGSSVFQIVDASPTGTEDLLVFSDENRTDLDESPDPDDPTAVHIASQYPTMRCVRLISDQPVACRQVPRKYLELRLGNERLLGPLPNPSLRSAMRGDVLFQVIKYRTQPFST